MSAGYGGEAAIVAHQAVHIKGVYFEVPSNTRLLFGVSVIKFEKDKVSAEIELVVMPTKIRKGMIAQ